MKLATLCYVMKDNHTLMLFRNKKENDYHEGKWNGLGGKFEAGETPQECAIREVLEETGLTVKNPVLKGLITFPMFDTKDDWYVFLFTMKEFEGDLIDSPEGHLEWIRDADLTKLNLWEGDKIFLPWIFQDKFFSAKFTYENGLFTGYTADFY
jgi:8-oxo-dGTP diphosphatase